MADYFVGEIRLFAFGFPPQGWNACDGTQLAMQQNAALGSLIGYQFGGNNSTMFALPNLRGRTPVHFFPGPIAPDRIQTGLQGSSAGADSVALTGNQIAPHSHTVNATSDSANLSSAGKPTAPVQTNQPGTSVNAGTNPTPLPLYIPPAASQGSVILNPGAISTAGAGAAHENRQPYLAANYCIALSGLYPTRP